MHLWDHLARFHRRATASWESGIKATPREGGKKRKPGVKSVEMGNSTPGFRAGDANLSR